MPNNEATIAELEAKLAELQGKQQQNRPNISSGANRQDPDDDRWGPDVPMEAQEAALGDPAPFPDPEPEPRPRGRGRPPKTSEPVLREVPREAPKAESATPPRREAASRAVAAARPAAVPAGISGIPDEMLEMYRADAGKGVTFAAEDLVIPRLILLQDNNPQVKDGTLGYVTGARPGLMMNSVTQEIVARALFIPVRFTRRYVGWRPRDDRGQGGGLFRPDVPREEYEHMEEVRIGKRIYMDPRGGGRKNDKDVPGEIEVVDTPEWSGLISFDGGSTFGPIAVDMAGTKAKVAGKVNTLISMQTMRSPDGEEFTPPCFASIFEIASKREGEGADAYFNYSLELAGRVTDPVIYKRARKLQKQFDSGEVEVAPLAGEP